MDREKAIRLKVFDLLTTAEIKYDEGVISIWDEKAEDESNNLYIVLRDQSASDDRVMCMKQFSCTLEIGVVCKTKDAVSKDIPDDIGEQVENALYAGLLAGVETNGWQFNNFVLDSANYSTFVLSPTDSEIEKTLIFRFTAIKL